MALFDSKLGGEPWYQLISNKNCLGSTYESCVLLRGPCGTAEVKGPTFGEASMLLENS